MTTRLPVLRAQSLPTIFNHVDTIFDDFFNFGDTVSPMDRILNKWYTDTSGGTSVAMDGSSYPKVNIIDFKDKVRLEATVTGIPREEIEVGIKTESDGSNFLQIKYDKKSDIETDGTYRFREIKQSKFMRSFALGENMDPTKISSSCKDGLLTVDILKFVEEEPIVEKYEKIDVS